MSCLEEARAAVEGAKQQRADLIRAWSMTIARIPRWSRALVSPADQDRQRNRVHPHYVASNPIRKSSR